MCEDYFRRIHKPNIYQLIIAGAGSLSTSEGELSSWRCSADGCIAGSDPRADGSQRLPARGQAATARKFQHWPTCAGVKCRKPKPGTPYSWVREVKEGNTREEIIPDKSAQSGLNIED